MIQSGHVYYILCLGPGEGNRWLNGETKKSEVDLAPDPTDPNSGTAWFAFQEDPTKNSWQFRCHGSLDQSQFLNGHTIEGTVNLDRNPDSSGTRWFLSDSDGQYYYIKCLGHVEGYRWLNGETRNASVNLKENHGSEYSGASWRFFERVL
jgi:hypothetical protein